MNLKISLLFLGILVLCSVCNRVQEQRALSDKAALGKQIFFDDHLSEPAGQSCATCHTADKGFADKESRAISEGARSGRFSNRNSMSIAYSAYVPTLHYDSLEQTYVGGLFWDGRVADLQTQAGEPFLNLLEMGNTSREMVVAKVRHADYWPELVRLYGESNQTDTLYTYITDVLAAYEQSEEINPFTSKFDAYVDGKYDLNEAEKRGLDVFQNKGLCAECHILEADPRAGRILFTDHTYDNLGIPRKPDHPYYQQERCFNPQGEAYIDLGLGAIVHNPAENGKFRVPTLRNIELTAPYGHNGYFATLEEIVHFYNVRDVPGEFPAPEYEPTVNRDELGDLKLTRQEEADLIHFMKTLTDGYAHSRFSR